MTTRPAQHGLPASLEAPDAFMPEMLDHAMTVELPAGQPVFHRGEACQRYLLVLAGRVKVTVTSRSGREIVLYHVGPGESCVLTTACLLGGDAYPAEGLTETEVSALLIDKPAFDRAMHASERFREFVFSNLGKRFSSVITRIEQVSFSGVDARLADFLLHQPDPGHILITHQELATDIGSAREVVSRHLKAFENNGWIAKRRGSITILNAAALRDLLNQ